MLSPYYRITLRSHYGYYGSYPTSTTGTVALWYTTVILHCGAAGSIALMALGMHLGDAAQMLMRL